MLHACVESINTDITLIVMVMIIIIIIMVVVQVKLLVAADMGDVQETLNASAFDTYDPSTKQWSRTIPCPPPSSSPPLQHSQRQRQTINKFTIASCQFAMHYMFQDIHRANHFFQQVSSNLQLGGVLIATTVDARVVADLAVRVDSEAPSGPRDYDKDLSIYADAIGDEEGLHTDIKHKHKHNRSSDRSSESESSGDVTSSSCPLMMNIHFDDQNWNKLLNINTTNNNNNHNNNKTTSVAADIDKDHDHDHDTNTDTDTYVDPFGIRYIFTLVDDPAKGNAVDAPEWLVPTGAPLRDLAATHGLEIDLCQNFHDFVYDKMTTDPSLRYTHAVVYYIVYDMLCSLLYNAVVLSSLVISK